jgi:hypothetical protein
LIAAVRWRAAARGIDYGELMVRVQPTRLALRIALVRVQQDTVAWRIEPARTGVLRGARWSIADTPAEALLAFNGGQFSGREPWGWIVSDSVELRAPAHGPLSAAFVVDDDGAHIVPFSVLAGYRGTTRPLLAIQSYPTLLWRDGVIPHELRAAGRGVDLEHRDGRFAICTQRDGSTLLALTRTNFPGVLAAMPLGLTTPEMAALMGALDCDVAVSLDGGISAQLMVRGPQGASWPGIRNVPLALVAF